MLNRRGFMISGLLASSFGLARPALAHRKDEAYVLPEEFLPIEVRLKNNFEPGEIHVDPGSFRLYLTLGKRKALRYTVGVGRGNLYHPGTFHVGRKKKWPRWMPTTDMVKRNPSAYGPVVEAGGMAGGINNPLGARAMYLYTASGRDTYLRIHGTNNPKTIGIAVSNGCARLINPQVEELFELVPVGTKVVLYPKSGSIGVHS